jgi:hypothetical protein
MAQAEIARKRMKSEPQLYILLAPAPEPGGKIQENFLVHLRLFRLRYSLRRLGATRSLRSGLARNCSKF